MMTTDTTVTMILWKKNRIQPTTVLTTSRRSTREYLSIVCINLFNIDLGT